MSLSRVLKKVQQLEINQFTKTKKMNWKALLEYADLMAVFKLCAVVLFIDLSFTAKVGIIVAIGLFLIHTGWKRYKTKVVADGILKDRLN